MGPLVSLVSPWRSEFWSIVSIKSVFGSSWRRRIVLLPRNAMMYLCCLDITLLEDLLDDLILVRSAELILEGTLACCVQDALGAVANIHVRLASSMLNGVDVLVGDQDLKAADNLGERNAGVLLPLLDSFCAVNEDDEVLGLALVVDLGLLSVATSHVDCLFGLRFGEEIESNFREFSIDVKAE